MGGMSATAGRGTAGVTTAPTDEEEELLGRLGRISLSVEREEMLAMAWDNVNT